MKRTGLAVAGLMLAVLVAPVRAQDAEETPNGLPETTAAPVGPGSPASLDLSSLQQLTPPPDAAAAAAFDAPAGDGRRTLSAFPVNVARGVIGVFSRDSLVPFAIGSGLALAGHSLDGRVESSLRGSCISCGSAGSRAGGMAVVPVVGALFLAGRFAPQGAFRAASYDFAQALVVNVVWTHALKYSLHRQRPDGSDYYSLPSGHTSTAFSLATVAEQHFGWKAGVPAYLLATSIGLSRIESNKHYLSDVIAGAAIGVITGRTVTRVDGAAAAKHKTLSLHPATDPHGSGVGVGMSASW